MSNKLQEDPHLYRGRRGFHVIFHSHPDLTHAWSEDGIAWEWNQTTMGPPNHMNSTGGDNERPRVVVDENGDVAWLFVGQLCGQCPSFLIDAVEPIRSFINLPNTNTDVE